MELNKIALKIWIRELVKTTEKMDPALKYRIIFSSLKVISEPVNNWRVRKISYQYSELEDIARFFLVMIQSYKNRPAGQLVSPEESQREMKQANDESFESLLELEKEFLRWVDEDQPMKDRIMKLTI